MNNTITLPDPPSAWDELTKEQLIFIHSLPRSEMSDSVFKMKVFLHLCNLELCGESFYTPPSTPVPEASASASSIPVPPASPEVIDDINAQLSWMESVIQGTADITVVLRPVSTPSSSSTVPEESSSVEPDTPLYCIPSSALFDAISAFTAFIDDPYHLEDCKLDTIHIGSHMYQAPAPQMISLTYEQYQDAQSFLGQVWNISQSLDEMHKQMLQLMKQAEKNGKTNPEDVIPKDFVEQMSSLTESLKDCQASFLSRVLTLMDVVAEDVTVLDADGSPVIDKRTKKPKTQTSTFFKVRDFSSEEADRMIPELKHAPHWLFPLMYQWFQSSLQAQAKNFSKLFSGKKGGGDSNPLVATISTLNTLMKEQGYHDQQAVLSANAIFNFQKLDALTRQAEEMERMNKQMKSKSRRK